MDLESRFKKLLVRIETYDLFDSDWIEVDRSPPSTEELRGRSLSY